MHEIGSKQSETSTYRRSEGISENQKFTSSVVNDAVETSLNDRLKRLSVVLTEPVSGITVHTAVGNSIQPIKAKEAVAVAVTVASKPGRTHQQSPFRSQFLTLSTFRREKSPGTSPEQSPKDNTTSIFKKAAHPLSASPNKVNIGSKEDHSSSNSSSTTSMLNEYIGNSLARSRDGQDSSTLLQSQGPPMTRTQQKLLLQRQHFLADDANYLHHPRNQLRLSKETERIQREFIGIQQFENPLTDSLRRVMERKRVEVVRVFPSKASNVSFSH